MLRVSRDMVSTIGTRTDRILPGHGKCLQRHRKHNQGDDKCVSGHGIGSNYCNVSLDLRTFQGNVRYPNT
jgi:hypothetical protein